MLCVALLILFNIIQLLLLVISCVLNNIQNEIENKRVDVSFVQLGYKNNQ